MSEIDACSSACDRLCLEFEDGTAGESLVDEILALVSELLRLLYCSGEFRKSVWHVVHLRTPTDAVFVYLASDDVEGAVGVTARAGEAAAVEIEDHFTHITIRYSSRIAIPKPGVDSVLGAEIDRREACHHPLSLRSPASESSGNFTLCLSVHRMICCGFFYDCRWLGWNYEWSPLLASGTRGRTAGQTQAA